MKRWVFLAVAIGILLGAAVLLLNTRQAPDVIASGPDFSDVPVSPLASEVPVALPQPVSDQSAVVALSTDQFRALGAEVMRALPKKSDPQKAKVEEAQGLPSALIAAGVELAKISEAVAIEPALEGEAITLYRECAVSPQHPDSVRALCYANYKKLSIKSGAAFNEKLVNKSLRQLSDKLDF